MSTFSNELNHYLEAKFTQEELKNEFDIFDHYYAVFWNYENFDINTSDYTAAHFDNIQTQQFVVTFCKSDTFRKNIKSLSECLSSENYLCSSYNQIPNPAFQTSDCSTKFSELFIYVKMQFLIDILKPYQPSNVNNIMELKIPKAFYPVYIALLKNASKFKQHWKKIKELILEDINYFNSEQHKQPYINFFNCSTDEYMALCKNWLDWFLPNSLYDLSLYFDQNENKTKDHHYNFSLLISDIRKDTACFKTNKIQNEFYGYLLKQFEKCRTTPLVKPKLYPFNETNIEYTISKTEYTIFQSALDTFYSWEDTMYQKYKTNLHSSNTKNP